MSKGGFWLKKLSRILSKTGALRIYSRSGPSRTQEKSTIKVIQEESLIRSILMRHDLFYSAFIIIMYSYDYVFLRLLIIF